jgi:hypothetical protein
MDRQMKFDMEHPPGSEAWVDADTHEDANWARREFEGLNAHQAWKLFEDNVLGAAESIGFMPDEAFKYYVVALATYAAQLDFQAVDDASTAVSCLFGYLEARKKVSEQAVKAVEPLVKPVLLKLAAAQRENDMPEDIYGDLSLRAQALLS